MIKITLPDGSVKEFEKGVSALRKVYKRGSGKKRSMR